MKFSIPLLTIFFTQASLAQYNDRPDTVVAPIQMLCIVSKTLSNDSWSMVNFNNFEIETQGSILTIQAYDLLHVPQWKASQTYELGQGVRL